MQEQKGTGIYCKDASCGTVLSNVHLHLNNGKFALEAQLGKQINVIKACGKSTTAAKVQKMHFTGKFSAPTVKQQFKKAPF